MRFIRPQSRDTLREGYNSKSRTSNQTNNNMNGIPETSCDRIEQQLSDTVSVASTVKVSNVASVESRHYSPSKAERRFRNEESELRIAPTLSSTDVSGSSSETFLLRTLQSLSRNDLQRVLKETSFAGKSIQELQSIWNELKPEQYQSLIQSFFYHMRIEKRNVIRSLFRQCLDSRPRTAETKDKADIDEVVIPLPIRYSSENTKTLLTKTSHHPLVTVLVEETDHVEATGSSPADVPKKETNIGGAASVASV